MYRYTHWAQTMQRTSTDCDTFCCGTVVCMALFSVFVSLVVAPIHDGWHSTTARQVSGRKLVRFGSCCFEFLRHLKRSHAARVPPTDYRYVLHTSYPFMTLPTSVPASPATCALSPPSLSPSHLIHHVPALPMPRNPLCRTITRWAVQYPAELPPRHHSPRCNRELHPPNDKDSGTAVRDDRRREQTRSY